MNFYPKITIKARSDTEPRLKAVIKVDTIYFVVVYTVRETAIRIISFRRAKRKERRRYEHEQQNRPLQP